MAVLNPEHLLEQAERLITRSDGPPREVDRRRAVSSAYYAVFHFILTAAEMAMPGPISDAAKTMRWRIAVSITAPCAISA